MQHGIVAPVDRLIDRAAQSRPREDRLICTAPATVKPRLSAMMVTMGSMAFFSVVLENLEVIEPLALAVST